MKFEVRLPGERALEVELPELRPGAAVEAAIDGRRVPVLLLGASRGELVLEVDGRRYALRLEPIGEPRPEEGGGAFIIVHRNRPYAVTARSDLERVRARAGAGDGGPAGSSRPVVLYSLLPGVIRQVYLEPGAEVERGTPVLTLEAMKMENEIRAEGPGRIDAILVRPGQTVAAREPLARILPG